MNLTHNELIAKGYVQGADGVYRKPVAGLPPQKPEPIRQRENEVGRVGPQPQRTQVRVVLTVFRRKLLDDHDNARMALKPLADHITRMLRLKDDRQIEWHYAQIKSPIEGTHVLISL